MKKILLTSVTMLATLGVNAAYLYWQVDDSSIAEYNTSISGESYYSDYSATSGVYFKLKDSAGNYYGGDGSSGVASTFGTSGVVSGGAAAVGGAYYSSEIDVGYSYFVEMYRSDNTLIARSQSISTTDTATWNQAYSDTVRTATLSQIPTIQIWHAGSFTAAPEPTSAILMLFGAAFLGLKRKNRSLA